MQAAQVTFPKLPTPSKRPEFHLVQAEIPVELFERMEKVRTQDKQPITRKSIVIYGIERWLAEVEKQKKAR